MSSTYVLDSFAVLALVNDEPGASQVRALLEEAKSGDSVLVLSLMNLGEIVYTTIRRSNKQDAGQVLAMLDNAPIAYLEVTRERVLAAAYIKASHRLSYADAFAAAAAQELEATIVTGNPEFAGLEGELRIAWLPRPEV